MIRLGSVSVEPWRWSWNGFLMLVGVMAALVTDGAACAALFLRAERWTGVLGFVGYVWVVLWSVVSAAWLVVRAWGAWKTFRAPRIVFDPTGGDGEGQS